MLTMSGTAVDRVEKKGEEAVLQIEVTTNRPDCLSILGLAQEVSALTGKKIKFPKIQPEKRSIPKGTFAGQAPKVEVDDKKGCPRYTARLIAGVSIKSTPQEAQKYLDLCGSRPINNAVDATNFVLFEMGQPLHAFDYDKLKGGTIVVRRARKNEKFLGIDGVEYTLDEKTLVIADLEKPVAIAGVIGGKLTEVTSETKNILLESAFFDPVLVRHAARQYKISTESSYRFEREVDVEKVATASARARDLISEWAGGTEAAAFIDKDFSKKIKPKQITLRVDRAELLLGFRIPQSRIMNILNNLGFKTKAGGKDKVIVTTHNSRRDINHETDLIEEILRIEGFEKVPAVLPITRHRQINAEDKKAVEVLGLKKFIAGLGFNEIVTYSFQSGRALLNSGFENLETAQKIKNPVSVEHEFLRPTLLPGMLQVISFNINRKAETLRLFEIGNRYLNGKEETVLAISIYGPFGASWQRKGEASFFDLKGVIENILASLKLKNYEWGDSVSNSQYEASSCLKAAGHSIGALGLLNPDVLKKWDIPREVFYAEILLENICHGKAARAAIKVKPVPKFPSVRRDIAIVVDEKIQVKALEDLMRRMAAPHLQEVNLFDQFTGKNIPAGKRSLAFSLAYQKETGTFTDEEINGLQNRVNEALKNEYHVEFR